ncbi:zonular occludens toxin domain-containing protein [Uliginosibacterium sp. 31-12]|uniref:zonular occludens toxin domain-containing protein n=1 Tax=Uliginosibacterium sp. 31-12 TaxID=3062781 RepID=UPI0026E1CC7A|nr:zonular occludens toxin domain-containing protein [Uliginosibacterium sp. 31-12]MDO6387643.1 zonular occludens toxin domain-containing protein [Uliginosibacterium sp. 31-12]
MAINAYTGLQGSGKSYEVTSSVIVSAIAAGRRVITNIDGINEEKIHEYLLAKNKAQAGKLGTVVHVTNERILQPAFFPDEEHPEVASVVLPGDLVAIDEAWRFWPADGGKLTHEHMQFFRMHRHYTHPETGVSCDVALMIQDISGLHRSVKNVVEFSFRTTKHKALGIGKRYRVEVFEGYKQTRTNAISRYQKEYDKVFFPMYKSYAGGNGNEKAIDDRTNIFKRWWLLPVIIGVTIAVFFSFYKIYRFFQPETHLKNRALQSETTAMPASAQAPGGPLHAQGTGLPPPISFSTAWRIAGRFVSGNQQYVVLASPTGRLRFESPSNFANSGQAMAGKIDGETVTYYSGTIAPPPVAPSIAGAMP